MILTLGALVDLARDAGFAAGDIPVAAAVAMAASGGNSHYQLDYGMAGTGHHVGLWAVDVDRHTNCRDINLHVPSEAAQVAYELTEQHRGFGWSPQYRSGTYRPYVAPADALAAWSPHRVDVPPLTSYATSHEPIVASVDAIRQARTALLAYATAKGR